MQKRRNCSGEGNRELQYIERNRIRWHRLKTPCEGIIHSVVAIWPHCLWKWWWVFSCEFQRCLENYFWVKKSKCCRSRQHLWRTWFGDVHLGLFLQTWDLDCLQGTSESGLDPVRDLRMLNADMGWLREPECWSQYLWWLLYFRTESRNGEKQVSAGIESWWPGTENVAHG